MHANAGEEISQGLLQRQPDDNRHDGRTRQQSGNVLPTKNSREEKEEEEDIDNTASQGTQDLRHVNATTHGKEVVEDEDATRLDEKDAQNNQKRKLGKPSEVFRKTCRLLHREGRLTQSPGHRNQRNEQIRPDTHPLSQRPRQRRAPLYPFEDDPVEETQGKEKEDDLSD